MTARSIAQHLEHLPLFPLPGAVLFPSMRMPLHIFEPRYRQMVEDARRDGLPIAIGHIVPGAQATEGEPQVHSVAGAGFIDSFQALPDGRFLIELVGDARVRILNEKDTASLYRVIRGEIMTDTPVSPHASKAAIDELRRVILAIHRNHQPAAAALSRAIADSQTAAEISDAIAAALQMDPLVLQSFLDETNPVKRLEKVTLSLESFLIENAAAPRTLN